MNKDDNNKPGFWGGVVTGLLIAVAAVMILFFGSSIHNLIRGKGFVSQTEDELLSPVVREKIGTLNNYIDRYYLDYRDDDTSGETPEDRAEGMYRGLVGSLDDVYSSYYSAKEYARLSESNKGSFEGIGVLIMQNDEGYFEISGFAGEDSSAKAAGVKVGDLFYEVDGERVTGIDMSELVDKVRGKSGTSVNIVMLRGEDMEKVEFTIPRKRIEAKTVSHNMLEKDTGYIIVAAFENITADQFSDALSDLKSKGMKRLIIDLRGNGGGMVDTAVNMADHIISTGVVTYTLDSEGNRRDYNAITPEALNIPLVILVDKNSASASELFTGAIKDYGLGIVVGTVTYGKGLVQNVYPLKDGSAIKLTNARYYTPNGVNIQGTGIEPDVSIEFDPDLYEKGEDNQLNKALEVLDSK